MAVAYPLDLRTIIRSGKARSQPAAFSMSMPRRGYGYAQATGTDTPVFWDVTFKFTQAEAAAFRIWFIYDLERGLQEFTIPIRTEFGLVTHTCRFLPDGLLDCREDGEVWTYTARIMARAEVIDTEAIGDYLGDPFYEDVVLLMHFDDSLVDECGHAFAADGTTNNTSGQFGDSRTIGGGTPVVYSVETSTDWDLQGDFTVEGWMYFSSTPSRPRTLVRIADGSDADRLQVGSEWNGYINRWNASWRTDSVNNSPAFGGASAIPNNTWHHLALTKEGSTFTLWANGVQIMQRASAYWNPVAAKQVFIGNSHRSFIDGLDGRVDEVRITNGTARYTADFTPPTAPFRVL